MYETIAQQNCSFDNYAAVHLMNFVMNFIQLVAFDIIQQDDIFLYFF